MADELSTGPAPTEGSTGAGSGEPAATPPIALTDTSTFIPPGGKDPVSWKDYSSGFIAKDELTRMRQRDAAERHAWQQAEQRRLEQEIRTRYEQQTQRQTQTQQGQQQAASVLHALRGQPYLSGEQAAGLVEQTILPMADAVNQMRQEFQQALGMLHQQVQQVRGTVGSISGKWSQTELQQMFATTKTRLGLPDQPIVEELLQDVYHSHTGWESDPQAFEATVKARWSGLQAAFREADRQKANAARTQPFAPGQPGGAARPGRPLVKGNESAEVLADRLFSGLQSVNT